MIFGDEEEDEKLDTENSLSVNAEYASLYEKKKKHEELSHCKFFLFILDKMFLGKK